MTTDFQSVDRGSIPRRDTKLNCGVAVDMPVLFHMQYFAGLIPAPATILRLLSNVKIAQ